MTKIDCFKCKHFYITWDKGFPYGCKAMGFKTKNMPSDVVYQSSGMECLKYEEKDKNPKNIIR
ncbi:MAG: uracil-DNA glycosylase [Nitrospirota bacterium]